MVAARATAATTTTLLTLIRRELNDPATDRSGNTIAETQREFADADLVDSLNNAVRFLQTEMSLVHPGDALLSVETSYTAGAASIALPSPIVACDRVFKVENITNTNLPLPIHEVSPLEIERYQSPYPAAWIPPTAAYRYTLLASGTAKHIAIRPKPAAGLTIRISYVAPPIVYASGDSVDLSATWIELLSLYVAKALMSRNGEWDPQQEERRLELLKQFRDASNRQKAPQRVRRKRNGLS